MIDNEIDSRRPFENIHDNVKTRFHKELEKHEQELTKTIDAIFDMIVKDYDRLFPVKENNDPNIKELQASLREFSKDAHAKLNGRIQVDLARAMRKGR